MPRDDESASIQVLQEQVHELRISAANQHVHLRQTVVAPDRLRTGRMPSPTKQTANSSVDVEDARAGAWMPEAVAG